MIICSCNVIRESQIREAALDGHTDVESLYASLGCAVQCGGCVPFAEDIIDQERRCPRALAA